MSSRAVTGWRPDSAGVAWASYGGPRTSCSAGRWRSRNSSWTPRSPRRSPGCSVTAPCARRVRSPSCRHPHIIVVHDVVEQDERPYIVMELIDGGSLAERISAERARRTRPRRPGSGIDLLGALRSGARRGRPAPGHEARERPPRRGGPGRPHRLRDRPGRGCRRRSPRAGRSSARPSTPRPSGCPGVRTGPESDLWSLGALLCTALSGESPFRRDSLGGILHAVVVDEIRPPAAAAPLLPVVRGLLERDPERRLDAVEAERMLRAFLDTGRMPAVSPGYRPTQRDAPRPQRSASRAVVSVGPAVTPP